MSATPNTRAHTDARLEQINTAYEDFETSLLQGDILADARRGVTLSDVLTPRRGPDQWRAFRRRVEVEAILPPSWFALRRTARGLIWHDNERVQVVGRVLMRACRAQYRDAQRRRQLALVVVE
jgi:hypothetical protein